MRYMLGLFVLGFEEWHRCSRRKGRASDLPLPTMGVSRRFLNLIVSGCSPGIKSLRRINLTRQQLFYPETLPLPDGDGSKSAGVRQLALKKMCLPEPSFTFKASNIALKMDCFPLADCKVICMDESGRGFFFDLEKRTVGTMPPLRKPKVPITVFVPKPDLDNDVCHTGDGSSLFLMERMSCGGGVQESDQFVGFIKNAIFQSWHCRLLTPPPFVLREPCNWNNSSCCYKITAYCVVGGGSHACISVEGVGTYCMDTASHVWSQVGEWTLPFHGKVEYVPELKLWFGLSADTQRLAAADLSTMDSQPRLMGPWKELNPPEEWKECKEPQFVSLGSGRFCIARFFQAGFSDDEDFAVLTGVEVSSQGSGNSNGDGGRPNVKLQMTPHKSKRVNNTSIEALF